MNIFDFYKSFDYVPRKMSVAYINKIKIIVAPFESWNRKIC